jgi:uncharacterized protein (TIGR03083 family)
MSFDGTDHGWDTGVEATTEEPDMDHGAALVEQNRLFGELVADADWSKPVPTCPGWTLLQLLRHVGRGDRWAAQIVADRRDTGLDPRSVPNGRPPDDRAGALAWLHDSARTVCDAVAGSGPDVLVWSFLGPRPAPWWLRRRLHESTVHRADAAIALGASYELAGELAEDGIDETLERLDVAGPPSLPPGVGVTLRPSDAGASWTAVGTGDGLRVMRDAIDDHAVLHGPVTDLFLVLTRRRPVDDTAVRISGDRGVWDEWVELLRF